MARNVGGFERALRILVAFVLLGLAFFHVLLGTLAILAYIVAAITLATAVFAFCPAWTLFGINTSQPRQISH